MSQPGLVTHSVALVLAEADPHIHTEMVRRISSSSKKWPHLESWFSSTAAELTISAQLLFVKASKTQLCPEGVIAY